MSIATADTAVYPGIVRLVDDIFIDFAVAFSVSADSVVFSVTGVGPGGAVGVGVAIAGLTVGVSAGPDADALNQPGGYVPPPPPRWVVVDDVDVVDDATLKLQLWSSSSYIPNFSPLSSTIVYDPAASHDSHTNTGEQLPFASVCTISIIPVGSSVRLSTVPLLIELACTQMR